MVTGNVVRNVGNRSMYATKLTPPRVKHDAEGLKPLEEGGATST